MAERNAARYQQDKEAWELLQPIHRLHATRAQTGQRAVFRHTEENGAFERKEGKGGIDWYRYQIKVLRPHLLPFAKRLLRKFGFVMVQEDKAPSHASHYQQREFDLWEIERLLWPGNSPDLNAIEPTWFWMKRKTTKGGPIHSREELTAA